MRSRLGRSNDRHVSCAHRRADAENGCHAHLPRPRGDLAAAARGARGVHGGASARGQPVIDPRARPGRTRTAGAGARPDRGLPRRRHRRGGADRRRHRSREPRHQGPVLEPSWSSSRRGRRIETPHAQPHHRPARRAPRHHRLGRVAGRARGRRARLDRGRRARPHPSRRARGRARRGRRRCRAGDGPLGEQRGRHPAARRRDRGRRRALRRAGAPRRDRRVRLGADRLPRLGRRGSQRLRAQDRRPGRRRRPAARPQRRPSSPCCTAATSSAPDPERRTRPGPPPSESRPSSPRRTWPSTPRG